MADMNINKKIAENSTEISRKLPLISRAHQTAKNCNLYWVWWKLNKCMFYKNLRKFAIKQTNIIETFVEILTNNRAKNINKIRDEIEKKLETLTTNFSINKKVVRQAGESHPLEEDEPSLYGCSDLDEQIGWLVDTTKSPKVNFAINNDDSDSEESDENDLIKDIANDFSAVEQTGPPVGKNLANIINNVMFNSVIREKLVRN